MSDTPVMKKAKILREFNDAGAERRYFPNQKPEPEFTEGEFENLRLAGLVEEVVDTAVAAPVEGDAGKPGRKSA